MLKTVDLTTKGRGQWKRLIPKISKYPQSDSIVFRPSDYTRIRSGLYKAAQVSGNVIVIRRVGPSAATVSLVPIAGRS